MEITEIQRIASGSQNMNTMPIIAVIALAVSIVSLYFSRRSWRETYRPILVARVTTQSGGNMAICYNILVENCGNRPAKNARLIADKKTLQAAFNPKADEHLEGIMACFGERGRIPVLANGRTLTAYFGCTAVNEKDATWIPDSRFNIQIAYEDFEGRSYLDTIQLYVSDDTGFTGWSWGNSKTHP